MFSCYESLHTHALSHILKHTFLGYISLLLEHGKPRKVNQEIFFFSVHKQFN